MKLVYGRACQRCGADIPAHKNMSATCCDEPDCIRARVKETNAKRKAAKMEWARRPENLATQCERRRNRSDAQKRIDRRKSVRVAAEQQAMSPDMGGKYRPWTPEEDAVVLSSELSDMEKAYKLNRSYSSIKNRRYQIKTGRHMRGRPEMWTDDELAVLTCPDLTITEMAQLTGHSEAAVCAKRYKLRDDGIDVPMFLVPWTPKEDWILRSSQLTARELAPKLGRTESAVVGRARKLGVSLAYWDGWWTEEENAIITRTDLSRQQMAELTGRDPRAISNQRWKLRQRGLRVPKMGVCKGGPGHPYTPENTRIDARGYRHCRACERESGRRKRARVAVA